MHYRLEIAACAQKERVKMAAHSFLELQKLIDADMQVEPEWLIATMDEYARSGATITRRGAHACAARRKEQ
jgi:hypothetical protein